MNEEQQRIVQKWVDAGLIKPTDYWPFTQYKVADLLAKRKAEQQQLIDEMEEALL